MPVVHGSAATEGYGSLQTSGQGVGVGVAVGEGVGVGYGVGVGAVPPQGLGIYVVQRYSNSGFVSTVQENVSSVVILQEAV